MTEPATLERIHLGTVVRLNVATAALRDVAAPLEGLELDLGELVRKLDALTATADAAGNAALGDQTGLMAAHLRETIAHIGGKYALALAALDIAAGATCEIPQALHSANTLRPDQAEQALRDSIAAGARR